jgi:iron complex outermembrane receptor protein
VPFIINTPSPASSRANAEMCRQPGPVEGKGSITGPLIADKLAFRVSGYYTQTDGNYRNLSSIEKQNAGRAKAFVRNCCSRRPTSCRSA